jgi:hypothetical protein
VVGGLGNLTILVNVLNGTIGDPDFTGSLAQLHGCGMVGLNLEGNDLGGDFSPKAGREFWGGTLARRLRIFNLANNWIGGGIPDMRRAKHLRTFELATNWINGSLPDWLGELPYLERLNLGGNAGSNGGVFELGITGTVPSSLGRLKRLRELNLESNSLNGELPELCVGAGEEGAPLHPLTVLNLRQNRLEGSRTAAKLVRCTSLVSVDFSFNRMSGAVPVSSTWENLGRLQAAGNRFDEPLPPEMFLLPYLAAVDASANLLTGPLPFNITLLTYLSSLWLSANQLSGEIPAELFYLTQLSRTYLDSNQFSGALPSQAVGTAYGLLELVVSRNPKLSGDLPDQLAELPFLRRVDARATSMSCADTPEALERDAEVVAADRSLWLEGGGESGGGGGDSGSSNDEPPAEAVALYREQHPRACPAESRLPCFLEFTDDYQQPLRLQGSGGGASGNGGGNGGSSSSSTSTSSRYSANTQGMTCRIVRRRPTESARQKCEAAGVRLSVPGASSGEAGGSDWGGGAQAAEDLALLQSWDLDPSYFQYSACKCMEGYQAVWLAEGTKLVCEPSKETAWWVKMLAALVGAALLLTLAAVIAAQVRRARYKPRWLRHQAIVRKRAAGVPRRGQASVVVTDIEGYSDLFRAQPQLMGRALAMHNAVLRRCCWAQGGHVVEQEGDSFTLAFYDPADAVAFCLQAQLALQRVSWPAGLGLAHYGGGSGGAPLLPSSSAAGGGAADGAFGSGGGSGGGGGSFLWRGGGAGGGTGGGSMIQRRRLPSLSLGARRQGSGALPALLPPAAVSPSSGSFDERPSGGGGGGAATTVAARVPSATSAGGGAPSTTTSPSPYASGSHAIASVEGSGASGGDLQQVPEGGGGGGEEAATTTTPANATTTTTTTTSSRRPFFSMLYRQGSGSMVAGSGGSADFPPVERGVSALTALSEGTAAAVGAAGAAAAGAAGPFFASFSTTATVTRHRAWREEEAARSALFYGLRVRMGIATGVLPVAEGTAGDGDGGGGEDVEAAAAAAAVGAGKRQQPVVSSGGGAASSGGGAPATSSRKGGDAAKNTTVPNANATNNSGVDIRNSAVFDLAKVVSDAGSGGQILMEAVTFALVKDRMHEFGAVDHNGINEARLAQQQRRALALSCGGLGGWFGNRGRRSGRRRRSHGGVDYSSSDEDYESSGGGSDSGAASDSAASDDEEVDDAGIVVAGGEAAAAEAAARRQRRREKRERRARAKAARRRRAQAAAAATREQRHDAVVLDMGEFAIAGVDASAACAAAAAAAAAAAEKARQQRAARRRQEAAAAALLKGGGSGGGGAAALVKRRSLDSKQHQNHHQNGDKADGPTRKHHDPDAAASGSGSDDSDGDDDAAAAAGGGSAVVGPAALQAAVAALPNPSRLRLYSILPSDLAGRALVWGNVLALKPQQQVATAVASGGGGGIKTVLQTDAGYFTAAGALEADLGGAGGSRGGRLPVPPYLRQMVAMQLLQQEQMMMMMQQQQQFAGAGGGGGGSGVHGGPPGRAPSRLASLLHAHTSQTGGASAHPLRTSGSGVSVVAPMMSERSLLAGGGGTGGGGAAAAAAAASAAAAGGDSGSSLLPASRQASGARRNSFGAAAADIEQGPARSSAELAAAAALASPTPLLSPQPSSPQPLLALPHAPSFHHHRHHYRHHHHSSSLPAVTMVFVSVEGARALARRRRPLARAVHRLLSDALRASLADAAAAAGDVPPEGAWTVVRGIGGGSGYLCREQEGELKYMVSFPTAREALAWCLVVQEALMHAPWPRELLEHCPGFEEVWGEAMGGGSGGEKTQQHQQSQKPQQPQQQLLFRGPRLKMGVCEGLPRAISADHLGRADYHGASVNQAARYMDAAAHGGAVACELSLAERALREWAVEIQREREEEEEEALRRAAAAAVAATEPAAAEDGGGAAAAGGAAARRSVSFTDQQQAGEGGGSTETAARMEETRRRLAMLYNKQPGEAGAAEAATATRPPAGARVPSGSGRVPSSAAPPRPSAFASSPVLTQKRPGRRAHTPVPVEALHLGLYQFKGGGAHEMACLLPARLAARPFPLEPPGGKGQRLEARQGVAAAGMAPLPDTAARLAARWRRSEDVAALGGAEEEEDLEEDGLEEEDQEGVKA